MPTVFEFELLFALPGDEPVSDEMIDRLYEAGLDDAVVGTGMTGMVAVSMEREGEHAEGTILEAIQQCLLALPEGSELREVRPDLVSLAEVAGKLDVSRQALQKRRDIPKPAVAGLYRTSEIYKALLKGEGKTSRVMVSASGWFEASAGAQSINARMALGEYRPSRGPDKRASG